MSQQDFLFTETFHLYCLPWKGEHSLTFIVSGLLLSVLATLVSAAETDYVKKVLGVKTWAVGLAVLLVIAGTFPRIQVRKLGIQRGA